MQGEKAFGQAWPCVFMRKPMACRLGKAAGYGILICGRDWRGPPQAGCASNGAGRVPRNPGKPTQRACFLCRERNRCKDGSAAKIKKENYKKNL